jgi:hypothetical protein
MQNLLTTLHEFLLAWLTNEDGFRDENPDLKTAMTEHGFGDVGPEELREALPLVAEDMPLDYQRSVYQYLSQSNVDSGSTFNVDQGGPQAGNVAAEGTAAVAAAAGPMETYPDEEPLDAAVRHIYNIQNNYSYIDDSGDVTNTVTNLGGNVDFDANSATGDGSFAGDDAEGVVQGDNYGINAGDDVEDSEVFNVSGDGAVVGNEVDEGANVVTGDVGGNFVGDDVSDSSLVGGDNFGQSVGDAEGANVIGGDSGIAAAGEAYIDAEGAATNVGDHGEANVVDVDSGGFGQGATQVNVGSGTNTNVIDDSFDTEIKDSFNTEDSFNDDSYNDDSYNEVDIDQEAYAADGYGHDGGGDAHVEQDADVHIGDDDSDLTDLADAQ